MILGSHRQKTDSKLSVWSVLRSLLNVATRSLTLESNIVAFKKNRRIAMFAEKSSKGSETVTNI